jgi:hypothetical protein
MSLEEIRGFFLPQIAQISLMNLLMTIGNKYKYNLNIFTDSFAFGNLQLFDRLNPTA